MDFTHRVTMKHFLLVLLTSYIVVTMKYFLLVLLTYTQWWPWSFSCYWLHTQWWLWSISCYWLHTQDDCEAFLVSVTDFIHWWSWSTVWLLLTSHTVVTVKHFLLLTSHTVTVKHFLLLTSHTVVTMLQTWRTPNRTRRMRASPQRNEKALGSCWTVVSSTHSGPCTLTKRRSTPSGPTSDRPGRRTLDGV